MEIVTSNCYIFTKDEKNFTFLHSVDLLLLIIKNVYKYFYFIVFCIIK